MEDKKSELTESANEIKDQLVDRYREFDERYDSTRDKVYAVNNSAIEFIQENPAVAIAAAVGVGYLVGRMASRRWIV